MTNFVETLKLNRNLSFRLNLSEDEFLRQLRLFIDTESNINLNPFATNKKKYKGNIEERNFSIKRVSSFGDIDGMFTSFASIKGNYEVKDKNIIVNVTTQISPGLQIYFSIMGLIILCIMLTIPRGWIFILISIVFIYPMLLLSVISLKEILKDDFNDYFKNKIKLRTTKNWQ